MKLKLNPNLRIKSAAAAAAFALPLLATRAQTPPPSSDETVTLSEFNVSTTSADRYRATDAISAVRVRAALIDTPSSITVLTRDLIDDLAPTRIFDVTRFVAGVQDGRGVQFQDRMILRGFESNGQRTVDNFLQPADADNIDEAVIERIEVAKGPNAILSPSGAPGGSINIITKSPLYKTKRTISAQVGLYDSQKISMDLTGAFAPGSAFAYRLVGSFQDSRRYWSSEADLRGKVLAPMFAWKVSDRSQLVIKLVAAEHWAFREPLLVLDPSVDENTENPFLAPGLAKKSLNGIQPWSHVGTHTGDLFAQFTSALTQNLSLRVAANGRYYFEDSDQEFVSTPTLTNRYNPMTGKLTQDTTWALAQTSLPYNAVTNPYVGTFSPFFNPTSVPVRGDIQWSRRKTTNLQADLVGKFELPFVNTQTVAGAALSHQTGYTHGKSQGNVPPIDLTNPNARWYPTYLSTLQTFNTSSFTNEQYYVNERLGFWKERIQLTGGVLRFETRTTARNVLTNAVPSVLDDGKNMTSVGALIKPLENVSVYYSHSTNSSPTIANNLALWRDGKQDEVGLKTEFFNQQLGFNAAYFHIAQTNVTTPNPDHQNNPSAPEQLLSDLTNHGLEFELTGSLTRELSIVATYSHLQMRDKLGRKVRAVADDIGALLLNYHFKQGDLNGLAVDFGVNYTGKRAGDTPINFTPLNVVGQVSFYLKPMYSTTAGVVYNWKNYGFRLNIDNLFDDKNYLAVAGGRVSGTGLTTATGINVKFTTTVKF
jgi:iron complex outermembrane receptor protein